MSTPELRAAQRRGTAALAGREVRRVLTLWMQTILPPIVTATIFLAVFGGALGGRLREVEGITYLEFILPGLLVVTAVSQAFANTSTSLFQAKNEGYLDDILTSPLRGRHLALSYMTGGIVRGLAGGLAVALLAAPFTGAPEHAGIVITALVLSALVFSALGVVTGMWADTFDQHSFVAAIVVAPLALLGGVFYAPDSLDEPWRTLTRLDPITYLVDATRAGYGGVHEAAVGLSLAVSGVAALTLSALAAALLSRGWRLRP